MSDEDKKDSVELRQKLNDKLTNSGVRFQSIKKVDTGQYQLLVAVDEKFFHQETEQTTVDYKKKSGINNRIIPREPEAGSLLEKLKLTTQADSLRKRLEIGDLKHTLKEQEKSALNTRYRDQLTNSYIDNRRTQADESKAIDLYDRSEQEYYKTGIYGTAIDLLSNFSATGFYNEINDLIIKEYYDSWVNDSNFLYTVKKIFHSLFKYSVCYIVKSYGSYEPHFEGISSIPGRSPQDSTKAGLKANLAFMLGELIKNITGKEMSFNKFNKIYDKTFGANAKHPLYYSVLDPRFVKVTSTGFFDGSTITLTPQGMTSLREMLKLQETDPTKLSKKAKDSLKYVPTGLKEAAVANKEYIFKDEEISTIYLRKDDYTSYAKPRGSRAFDSFDYKEELKKADFATVDGITNFILKVTIGDKDNPVTDEVVLEDLAEAFNTPQKAFTIVWNHTLQIEKITATEAGSILGKAKYEPVESDISAAIGMARAMIDGTNISGDAAALASKATQSEIENARQQVEDWIYYEYRVIAKVAGFNTYPVVRWKQTVITTDGDAVTRASYMQMLDRKAMSIQTYMREMGLDYETEKQRMTEELPLIQQDILRAGSPYQAKSTTPIETPTPSGDSGRPKGQPTITKEKINDIKTVKRKTKIPSPSQQGSENNIGEDKDLYIKNITNILEELSPEIKIELLNSLNNSLTKKDKD